MTEHRLARLDRDEVLRRVEHGVVAVPTGALEQHGPHLPIGTDFMLIEELVVRAAARAEADVLVAPAVWTGFSHHHMPFGATVSLSPATYLAVVRETVEAIRRWAPRVVVVNGHGGNRGPLITLGIELGLGVLNYWETAPDVLDRLFAVDGGSVGHAGQVETSFVASVMPELVGERSGRFDPIGGDRSLLIPTMGATGVLGDPTAADAEAGAEALEVITARVAAWLDQAVGGTA